MGDITKDLEILQKKKILKVIRASRRIEHPIQRAIKLASIANAVSKNGFGKQKIVSMFEDSISAGFQARWIMGFKECCRFISTNIRSAMICELDKENLLNKLPEKFRDLP
ncbi:MAG: hypothetical protein NTZ10_03455 [Candidatus Saganbacteria bacterium]|nr:hypothetical protein [Candidatus Saganbacteria bacterium]